LYPVLIPSSDIRLHEQTNKSDGVLKRYLLDQLRLMGIMANAARAIPIGRMPWHNAAVIRNNRTMRDYLLPHIQRKMEMGAENLNKKTILDLAIHQSDGDQQQDLSQKPNAEFVDSLISNLKAFLFAGHDTTASSICFMTKLLQDNPDCLEKLRAEHAAVLGTDVDKTAEVLKVSPHLLQSLPYTVGVIEETLRLYPLAATVRESHAGLRLTGTDSSIEYPMGGFGLWLSAPTIQRHPGCWTRPDECLPERWLVNDGPLRPPKNAWVPFSLGPRNCIGMELAMMELKLVSIFTARTLSIEEAWTEWDQER
jgi:cytochrome P450